MSNTISKVWWALFVLTTIVLTGILGFMYIEGYTYIDSLYMTVMTISTVGFGEIAPLSDYGKIFTSFLILSGISVVIYAISNLTSFFVEGEMKSYLRSKKMNNQVSKLSDHYILAGYGRTGQRLVEEFYKKGASFVVIEKHEENLSALEEKYQNKVLFIIGDATDDDILLKAGIKRACCIISSLSTDADNLFVTISAKYLNKNIKVITRALESSSADKLIKAGADKIISPLEIAANRMFATATQSEIVSFLDIVGNTNTLEDLNFASVEILANSSIANSNLREARLPERANLVVIGIEKSGELQLNPRSHTILHPGDKLLVLGSSEQLENLKVIVQG